MCDLVRNLSKKLSSVRWHQGQRRCSILSSVYLCEGSKRTNADGNRWCTFHFYFQKKPLSIEAKTLEDYLSDISRTPAHKLEVSNISQVYWLAMAPPHLGV